MSSSSRRWRPIGIIPANTGRICGGVGTGCCTSGSSPRIRGESPWSWPITCPLRDHPREYGENTGDFPGAVPGYGSSPRIRGESLLAASLSWPTGIIPANTGRISEAPGKSYTNWDHPREYGENAPNRLTGLPMPGSSPRIRGESVRHGLLRIPSRIIPANTGRIELCSLAGVKVTDHPREYGENLVCASIRAEGDGSSPRIRGEYRPQVAQVARPGIIPANTGRICPQHHQSRPSVDHPREYGENDIANHLTPSRCGSSPRIRGESPAGPAR